MITLGVNLKPGIEELMSLVMLRAAALTSICLASASRIMRPMIKSPETFCRRGNCLIDCGGEIFGLMLLAFGSHGSFPSVRLSVELNVMKRGPQHSNPSQKGCQQILRCGKNAATPPV